MPLSDQTRAILGLDGPTSPSVSPRAMTPAPTTPRRGMSPQTRRILGLPDAPAVPAPAPAVEDDKSFLDWITPHVMRIGGPILGGAAGGALAGSAVFPGVGTATGAIIGGALGAAGGEAAAEKYEGRDLNPTEIALSGALGAVPAGPAGRIAGSLAKEAAETGVRQIGKRALLHAVEGATQGALAETAGAAVREHRFPTTEELVRGAGVGTVLGSTLGTGADVLLSPRAGSARPRPEVEPVLPGERPPFPETAPRDIVPPDLTPEPPPFVPSERVDTPPVIVEPAPFLDRPAEVAPSVPAPEPAPFPMEPAVIPAADRRATPREPGAPVLGRDVLNVDEAPEVITPVPRSEDRRVATEPTAVERRLAARRTQLAGEVGLPEEHPAVERMQALEVEARTDPLTGLANKRGWEELKQTIGDGDQVVIMDGKKFKTVNDTYGHDAGDAVLKNFGSVVREVFGEEASRHGGDEFGAILRRMAPEEADAAIARLQERAAQVTTRYHNPTTGEVIDIPPLEVHIARGANEKAADTAVNAAAAPSRVGGRGDVPLAATGDQAGNPALPGAAGRPGEGLRPAPELATPPESAAPSVAAAEPKPPQSIPPSGERRMFDREAAIQRLMSRGRKANDLGSAAAEGAGALKDVGEIAGSYIEEYAQRNKGKIPSFEAVGRAVMQHVRDFVPNVGKFLRRVYDEAVALFRGRAPESAAAPVMPPQVEPVAPKAGPRPVPQPATGGAPPKPPAPPVPAEPMGAPKPAGEPPRVETKVGQLREVAPDAKLSRDTSRSWESLDPAIRQKVDEATADPQKEAALLQRAAQGKVNDVDMQAVDAIVAGKRQRYEEARQKYETAKAAGNESGPESVQYLAATLDEVAADLAKAARSDVEAGTKIARALAARARIMRAQVSATDPDMFMRRLFREIPDLSERHAVELSKVLRESPQDLGDALRAHLQSDKLDKFLEFWKNGLVSAPGTQVANVLGNIGEQVMRVGETATATVLDRLFAGQRTRLGGEASFELGGALKGAGKSLGRLGSDLRSVLTLAPEMVDLGGNLEHQVGKIGGTTGRAVRIPYRLLGAFDRFFQGLGGEAELHKLAWRAAGGNREKAMALVANPTADMMAKVALSQRSRTFQDPNKMASALMNLRSQNRLWHVVMPFIQTPANIMSATVERSPAGFVPAWKALRTYRDAVMRRAPEAEIAELKGVAMDKLARPLLGTMLIGSFGALAKAGGMTGSGPTDAKDKNALRDSGWQPYSFVIPTPDGRKVYVPFNRFEPVSGLLGFAADMAEARDAKTGNDLLAKGVGSVVQNLTSKSYLQGLADAAELVKDPMGAGSKYVTDLAASVVPNIVAKGAQTIDPTVRDTRPEKSGFAGVPEEIRKKVTARLPGLSSTLPERRSGTGVVAERQGNALTRFASPIQPSREKAGADFERLLVDIDAVPSPAGKNLRVKGVGEVRLTDAEHELIQNADLETTERLRRLVRAPSFRNLDPETQRKQIRQAYDRARDRARGKVMASAEFRARARAQRGRP